MKITTTMGIAAAALLSGHAMGQTGYAVTEDNELISFDVADPSTLLSGVQISGLDTNENVLGIDFRPQTNEVYLLGGFDNLYLLNLNTGEASLVGTGFDDALNGSAFGFDFNPNIDRIRVVSDVDQNLVLNPFDGTSTSVTNLFYAAGDVNEGEDPNVNASAYTNSVADAPSTQLFGIDTGLDILVTQANSAGTLNTVGGLGIDVSDLAAFDIFQDDNFGYAALTLEGESVTSLYTIDLTTGAATLVGEIGGGAVVNAFTVVPAPGVGAAAAVLGLAAVRRRRV